MLLFGDLNVNELLLLARYSKAVGSTDAFAITCSHPYADQNPSPLVLFLRQNFHATRADTNINYSLAQNAIEKEKPDEARSWACQVITSSFLMSGSAAHIFYCFDTFRPQILQQRISAQLKEAGADKRKLEEMDRTRARNKESYASLSGTQSQHCSSLATLDVPSREADADRIHARIFRYNIDTVLQRARVIICRARKNVEESLIQFIPPELAETLFNAEYEAIVAGYATMSVHPDVAPTEPSEALKEGIDLTRSPLRSRSRRV